MAGMSNIYGDDSKRHTSRSHKDVFYHGLLLKVPKEITHIATDSDHTTYMFAQLNKPHWHPSKGAWIMCPRGSIPEYIFIEEVETGAAMLTPHTSVKGV